MTTPKSDELLYNAQCMTCNFPEKIRNNIHEMSDRGVSYAEISNYLTENGTTISPDAVANHLKKHRKQMPKPDSEVPSPLLGVVRPKTKIPVGWEPRADIDGDTGEVTSTPQTDDKLTDFSKILEEFGIDPEEYEIDGTARIGKWQTYDERWLTSYKFRIARKKPTTFDLPTLFAEVRAELRIRQPAVVAPNRSRTLVVPFADLQAGKVGSRGDTKTLIERVHEKFYKLEQYALQQNCAEAVFLDGGDIVESFENTAQQAFTNDLSIMDQLDVAGTLEQDCISMLAKHHEKVTVAGVPSNHAAWRNKKDILGKPSDDWGLYLLRQIERAYKLNPQAFGHVEFQYPEEWRKSLNVEVQGIGIGLVHGDDVSRMDAIPTWWANQVHGASPTATSDILLTNHYHTLRVQPTGRSLRTGKQKYWIACPTLDNGSDWWANKAGSDSDPGLMAFVVDSEIGFDLQSFTVL